MSGQARLTLDDPTRPVPTRPTLIHFEGGQAHAEPFETLDALAARVRALAGPDVHLWVSEQSWPCAFPGFELFRAWSIYANARDGSTAWLGSAAIQQTPVRTLEAALVAERVAA